MAGDVAGIRGATLTETGLTLEGKISEQRWAGMGEQLGAMERAVGWWIGDWWNAGARYGEERRSAIVQRPDWRGPGHGTCRNYGSVCERFPLSTRVDSVPFTHYREVSPLPQAQAMGLLAHVEEVRRQTGEVMPSRLLIQEVKRQRRTEREAELAGDIAAASAALGSKLYGVICADPPWRFEPHSRITGMDRAADNHYPIMTVDEIEAMTPPAADDCALFLWAITPMLLEALDVMAAWRFDYRSHFLWLKPHAGTGYWNRSCHELLLVGVRGKVPAPAPGQQFDSVFQGAVGEHSVKPAAAYEMIEEMFPHAALLEMFARAPRLGWEVWGPESGGDSRGGERTTHQREPERVA